MSTRGQTAFFGLEHSQQCLIMSNVPVKKINICILLKLFTYSRLIEQNYLWQTASRKGH